MAALSIVYHKDLHEASSAESFVLRYVLKDNYFCEAFKQIAEGPHLNEEQKGMHLRRYFCDSLSDSELSSVHLRTNGLAVDWTELVKLFNSANYN